MCQLVASLSSLAWLGVRVRIRVRARARARARARVGARARVRVSRFADAALELQVAPCHLVTAPPPPGLQVAS